jgi:hypothetical protein
MTKKIKSNKCLMEKIKKIIFFHLKKKLYLTLFLKYIYKIYIIFGLLFS